MEEIKRRQELLEICKRRRHELKKKLETNGYSSDPSVQMEIEDIDIKIKELDTEISYHKLQSFKHKPNKKQRTLKIPYVTTILLISSAIIILLITKNINIGNTSIQNSGNFINSQDSTINQQNGGIIINQGENEENINIEDAIRVDFHTLSLTKSIFATDIENHRKIEYGTGDSDIPIYSISKDLSSKEYPFSDTMIAVDILGKSEAEEIKLAPYLVINMISAIPLTKTVSLITAPIGGVGYNFNFKGVISPKQNKLFGIPNENNVDYFTLKRGEKETFILQMQGEPDYKYTFRIGIMYSYKSEIHTKWSENTFTTISVREADHYKWIGNKYDGITSIFKYEKIKILTIAEEKEIMELMNRNNIKVSSEVYFRLKQQ